MDIEWYVILFRLFLAVILGGTIGIEREMHGHPAGLRTHVLVTLASCLAMLISRYGFNQTGDPARIAAQVVSGIGFLGAGAIIHDKGDIKGITTAATLWVAAIIGLAAGDGFLIGAIGTTLIALLVLTIFIYIEKYLGKKNFHIVIICKADTPVLESILAICNSKKVSIKNIEANIIQYGEIRSLKFSADFDKETPRELIEKTMLEINDQLQPLSISM